MSKEQLIRTLSNMYRNPIYLPTGYSLYKETLENTSSFSGFLTIHPPFYPLVGHISIDSIGRRFNISREFNMKSGEAIALRILNTTTYFNVKAISPDNIYYGTRGLIMDSNKNILIVFGGELLDENDPTSSNNVCYISPAVFSNTDPVSKYIVKKIIPTLVPLNIADIKITNNIPCRMAVPMEPTIEDNLDDKLWEAVECCSKSISRIG